MVHPEPYSQPSGIMGEEFALVSKKYRVTPQSYHWLTTQTCPKLFNHSGCASFSGTWVDDRWLSALIWESNEHIVNNTKPRNAASLSKQRVAFREEVSEKCKEKWLTVID